jgi:hypothetical protein
MRPNVKQVALPLLKSSLDLVPIQTSCSNSSPKLKYKIKTRTLLRWLPSYKKFNNKIFWFHAIWKSGNSNQRGLLPHGPAAQPVPYCESFGLLSLDRSFCAKLAQKLSICEPLVFIIFLRKKVYFRFLNYRESLFSFLNFKTGQTGSSTFETAQI